MFNDEFEWDDAKAEQNWVKHGVDFLWTTQAFRDACAIEWFDTREHYGEERVNMLANIEGIIVHVTYVEVETRVRIISARRATRHEKDRYFRENAID